MIPKDPDILFSYVNTALRDRYSSFDDFCDDRGLDPEEILGILTPAGFSYDPEKNRFV